jgi:protein TonB
MLPEKILNSSFLDLLFDNKNKAYGAYELRKNYNKRMLQSIAFTMFVVLVFGLFQSFKIPKKTVTLISENLGGVVLVDYTIPKDDPKPLQKVAEKKIQNKNLATAATATPIIVPDNKANNNMSTIDKILNSLAAGKESKGDSITTEIGFTKDKPYKGDEIGTNISDTIEASNSILEKSEIMPEFPGGISALIHYLQRNLQQPSDFEPGQKIVVVAQFVISTTGEIEGIEIIKSGRDDLDHEVVRVINKMPHWKPGMQNGRAVSVYFKVPITFVYQD